MPTVSRSVRLLLFPALYRKSPPPSGLSPNHTLPQGRSGPVPTLMHSSKATIWIGLPESVHSSTSSKPGSLFSSCNCLHSPSCIPSRLSLDESQSLGQVGLGVDPPVVWLLTSVNSCQPIPIFPLRSLDCSGPSTLIRGGGMRGKRQAATCFNVRQGD